MYRRFSNFPISHPDRNRLNAAHCSLDTAPTYLLIYLGVVVRPSFGVTPNPNFVDDLMCASTRFLGRALSGFELLIDWGDWLYFDGTM